MQLTTITGDHDLKEIGSLAKKIWHDHYTEIIGKAQVEYMLERMYDIDSLLQQQRDGHLFYLLSDNDCLVGFISIKQESDQDWFLNKLYIDTHRQGSGLGAFALDEILKLHEMQVLRLQVNRQNFKAINFYFKKGFTIERVADFEIGQGYFMNDFIMIWRKPQA